jgi:aspartyl-tRNA(Asn)/glutamyl-tRNA(Gln) amidotransferase subunit B
VALIEKGTISGKIAKTVFDEMYKTGSDPRAIVEAKGLVQVVDTGAIDTWVDEILSRSASQVADYKSGKTKLMGYFVGEVMKLSKGKANPPLVTEAIKRKLGG